MKKLVPLLLLVFVSLANGCGKSPAPPTKIATPPTPEEIAVEAIRELGATVRWENYSSNRGEVVYIDFWRSKVTDDDLVHLKGLTSLKRMWLHDTKITDAGLLHLEELSNLEELWLGKTKVSDAGLVHLKGLTSLTFLRLSDTQVTDAGIKKLQTALPRCQIQRK